ncbi:MAG: ASPIC/UnbV domain-containing protein, partial [Chlorobi bacterium]|nr:ASPIC/UnbV domain-containing protein [Chlorobiota bacterium]
GFSIGIRDSTFSYGAAKGDYNNDGYPDMCVTMSRDSNAHFYKNSGGSNKWLKLKCIGVQSNKDALGTIVTVYYNGNINRQVILGGSSFLSSDDVELIFGIENAAFADSVVIRWTNGTVDRSYNISANGRYTAVEGSGVIGIIPIGTEVPDSYNLYQNYPNPFNPGTKIKFSVPNYGKVTLQVFDVLGNEISVLVNENVKAGNYEIDFNASGLSSGIYFYKLSAGNFVETKKMMLVK